MAKRVSLVSKLRTLQVLAICELMQVSKYYYHVSICKQNVVLLKPNKQSIQCPQNSKDKLRNYRIIQAGSF